MLSECSERLSKEARGLIIFGAKQGCSLEKFHGFLVHPLGQPGAREPVCGLEKLRIEPHCRIELAFGFLEVLAQ